MPALPPEAVHLPFEPAPFRMAMALVPCQPRDWIEIDEHYPPEMALRRQLLADRHAEVFAALPVSDDGRRETLEHLSDHLTSCFPEWFMREDAGLTNRLTGETSDLKAPRCDPLELAGRLVQEDLCLVQPGNDGPTLIAAVLCFPSRWRLAEKIGRPLRAVHGPVPFYADRLARPVDRFMGFVRPGHVVMRCNWSVLDDPALFQPERRERPASMAPITADNAGETLFLRVERQTFARLPRSGAVLFGIRVHVYPLARVAGSASVAARLAEAVRVLPPDMTAYKAMLGFRGALLDWLAQRGS